MLSEFPHFRSLFAAYGLVIPGECEFYENDDATYISWCTGDEELVELISNQEAGEQGKSISNLSSLIKMRKGGNRK